MKTAVELIAEKHAKNMERFPADLEAEYHLNGELYRAAIFTLTKDARFYPDNWADWYLDNTMREKDPIENMVNAAALLCAEIERLGRLQETQNPQS